MDRVLKELENLRSSPDKDAVHDLRVAIRRSRSVGGVMQEVDPDPAWWEMRRLPKKLFRRLGQVRDAQIMDEWISEHGAENDKLRVQLHEFFSVQEPKLLDEALRMAEKFDEKAWVRLRRQLSKRVRLVAPESLAAQCLAVERYDEAKELHAKAIRTDKPELWHSLRIALKKLRYTTESFLPVRYQAWSERLKSLQDLLGEVHDLDVLSGIVKEQTSGDAARLQPEWERTIQRERASRLETYRELASGKNSFWSEWKQALPHGRLLQTAAMARIRVTSRATDAHPRRAAHVSRIAVAAFDAFRRAHVAPLFADHNMRRVLRAAARLCGINVKGSSGPSRKAARRFLLERPAPPSWTLEEWELLAWVVRYHRGPEPSMKKNAFTRLHAEQQMNVRAVAGIIRLARGLRSCGVETCAGLRAEKSVDAIILQVPGLEDSADTAARLAKGKHLLETYLAKPLILKTTVKIEKVIPLPAQPHEQFAAASD
jgi:CHAD domain-containing protein